MPASLGPNVFIWGRVKGGKTGGGTGGVRLVVGGEDVELRTDEGPLNVEIGEVMGRACAERTSPLNTKGGRTASGCSRSWSANPSRAATEVTNDGA